MLSKIKKVLALLIAGFVGYSWWIAPPDPKEIEAAKVAQAMANRAIAATRQPTWAKVEIENIRAHFYNFKIQYQMGIKRDFSDAAYDGRLLIRGMLKELVAAGISPSEKWIVIRVYMSQETRGESGMPLWINFGNSMYWPNNDQIKYER